MDVTNPETFVKRIERDFTIDDLEDRSWDHASPLIVDRYWSGESAPLLRTFEARLLWSEAFLYVRFLCRQQDPLVINESPDLTRKAEKLWERDVCEIFIAPNAQSPEEYFEFEVAPTGEWLDLKILQKPDERITDWNFASEMRTAARIGEEAVSMIIWVPWSSIGEVPNIGDVWRGNIFRAVGSGEDRGYLAWSPTFTEVPNFHVPERFGRFIFT